MKFFWKLGFRDITVSQKVEPIIVIPTGHITNLISYILLLLI